MFYDNFRQLCEEKGVSEKRAGIECGCSNSVTQKWKKGSMPNGSTLQKIADYFGVTVAYLLEEKENAQPELSEADKELFDVIGKLTDEEKKLMAGMGIAIMNRRGQK